MGRSKNPAPKRFIQKETEAEDASQKRVSTNESTSASTSTSTSGDNSSNITSSSSGNGSGSTCSTSILSSLQQQRHCQNETIYIHPSYEGATSTVTSTASIASTATNTTTREEESTTTAAAAATQVAVTRVTPSKRKRVRVQSIPKIGASAGKETGKQSVVSKTTRRGKRSNPFLGDEDDDDDDDGAENENNNATKCLKIVKGVTYNSKKRRRKPNGQLFPNDDDGDCENENIGAEKSEDGEEEKEENEIKIAPCTSTQNNNKFVISITSKSDSHNQERQSTGNNSADYNNPIPNDSIINTDGEEGDEHSRGREEDPKLILLQKIILSNVLLQHSGDNNDIDDERINASYHHIMRTTNGIKVLFDWIIKVQTNQRNYDNSDSGNGDSSSHSNDSSNNNNNNKTTSTAILNPSNYEYKCSSMITSAVESNLVQVSLSQQHQEKHQSKSQLQLQRNSHQLEVNIHLTEYASTISSPIKLGQNILSKNKHRKNQQIQHVILVQNIMNQFLFPHSILSDFVESTSTDVYNDSSISGYRGRQKGSPRKKKDDVITAKMVYNAIDNAHLHHLDKKQQQQKQQHRTQGKSTTSTDLTLAPTSTPELKSCRIEGLIPTLRQYQKAAVEWMLYREQRRDHDRTSAMACISGYSNDDCAWEICWLVIYITNENDTNVNDTLNDDDNNTNDSTTSHTSNTTQASNSLCNAGVESHTDISGIETRGIRCTMQNSIISLFEWQKRRNLSRNTEDRDKNIIFYNPVTGWLLNSYNEARKHTLDEETEGDSIVRGGILAESMGLGKTVELLACILSNPCPPSFLSRRKFHDGNKKNTEETSNNNDEKSTNIPSRNPDRHSGSSMNLVKSKQTHSSSYFCFCGKSETKRSLSWVRCRKCDTTMHGLCAGYTSEKELNVNTKPCSEYDNTIRICDEIHCPFCQYDVAHSGADGLIGSRATLIVTPTSILGQWEREIQRHTSIRNDTNDPNKSSGKPLEMLLYRGVKEICSLSHSQAMQSNSTKMLNPRHLADTDVILTSFDTLRSELGHCSDNPFVGTKSITRRKKKYRVLPSPLISLRFWRVCLDEAQRIETPTAASAKMVLNLHSHNKWCISGTPISRGKMNDIYGLYLFLNAKPFCFKQCFHSYLRPGYRDIQSRINHFTFDLMWRSTKANDSVRIQMGVPDQVEKKVILQFSSVERHFYERQLESTVLAADAAMKERKKARKKDIEELSTHLQKLRAACCHPQVGSSGISAISNTKKKAKQNSVSIANGVLNMAQILDRLIEDAKVKAEESQRVFTLHTNALANLNKLKAEAQKNGRIQTKDDELQLLRKCCDHYFEALNSQDKNSSPSYVIGEAVLSGNQGFQCQNSVVRDGAATLLWRIKIDESDAHVLPDLWSRFDFTGGSMKKINSFVVRPISKTNEHIQQNLNSGNIDFIFPKDCVLQVSNPALGGLYVDAIPFKMERPGVEMEWQTFSGIRPNKSKNWRVLIKTYHDNKLIDRNNGLTANIYTGLDVRLLEPDISYDNLQRMHILHNISVSLSSLSEKISQSPEREIDVNEKYSAKNITLSLKKMREESERLETHYIEAARVIQQLSSEKLKEHVDKRKEILIELKELSGDPNESEPWAVDLLSLTHSYGDPQLEESLCRHVDRRLFELFDDPSSSNRRTFPEFSNIDGLNLALCMRLQHSGTFHRSLLVPRCIEQVEKLSAHPSENEVLENSMCHRCRADWNQTGPLCRHCKLEMDLLKYEETIKEAEINTVLQAMAEWLNDNLGRMKKHKINLLNIQERMKKSLAFKSIALKELEAARRKWSTHFDLLSDIDELNQCKRSMRISYENENLFGLAESEAAFIVEPLNIAALIMEHTSKQAMGEANLRRSNEMLRFLKNQNLNIKEGSDERCCTICLAPFGNDRAVLRCGHAFHYSPCVEKLLSGGGGVIKCPMRCAIKTRKEDILIASEKRNDDGSKVKRKIEGCWGTKVDRLVADILDVIEKGDKAIIFSGWDDMLSIMEHALDANKVAYIRPKVIKKLGKYMKVYRTKQCNVLIMHVKHGAEGLTIVEANHVFLIEPLLNHSLDSQAINRIHRIGQTQKTFIHRYLIADTIEIKIDKIRMERHENNPDGEYGIPAAKSVMQSGEKFFCGGGVDGGFDQGELQELLH